MSKKLRVMVIPADLAQECYFSEVEDTWQTLGKIVDGYIEVVHTDQLYRVHPCLVMIVNEEGLLKGLPFNRRATHLYYPHGAGIVGDVILIGEHPSREYFIDLPAEIDSVETLGKLQGDLKN